MKALLVVDNENAISNISEVLKAAGYDVIVYKWLLKALDNVEEIAPHLLVISTKDYPRHWKTLVQYAKNIVADYTPQVILYGDEEMDQDELKKAEALGVRGIFSSVGVEGLDKLREILSKQDDIYSGFLTEPEQGEVSLSDIIPGLKDLSKEIASVQDILSSPIKIEKPEEPEVTAEPVFEEEPASEKKSEPVAAPEVFVDTIEDDFEEDEEVPTVSGLLGEDIIEEESEADEEIEENIEPETSEDIIEEEVEESAESDIIEEESDITSDTTEEPQMDEQSIEDKLAAIMNANKADAKEMAQEAGIESTSCSFVFTNPVTLAMVSGTARNYNGMTLEFTPDIPSFIMNLDAGTQINVASIKVNGEITNVRSEVMSNDSTKLYLQIKK